jgi:hypothetical protein
MEGGEPVQLTTLNMVQTIKWSPMVKKYYSHQVFHYKNYEDSILNKSYTLDNGKPGFKRMNI